MAFINLTVMDHLKLPSYNFNDEPVIRFGEAVESSSKCHLMIRD